MCKAIKNGVHGNKRWCPRRPSPESMETNAGVLGDQAPSPATPNLESIDAQNGVLYCGCEIDGVGTS